ncbi:MAG: hypothetical protein CM1200mP22_20550 [Dehalococcoidia bacterium]|nr:MAG: hypothetical protein CM1200mP22_20550 [Dehalococcoidia bacterium]
MARKSVSGKLVDALRQATVDHKLVPVMCGSAMFAKGVHNLLDAIVEYLPSPADVPAVEGTNPGPKKSNSETQTLQNLWRHWPLRLPPTLMWAIGFPKGLLGHG